METILTPGTIALFLDSLSERGRSGNTVRAYSADLHGLRAWTITQPSVPSTFEKIAATYLNQTRSTASPKTTTRRLSSFKSFAKFHGEVILADYIAPSPAKQEAHPIEEGISGVRTMIEMASTQWERALVSLTGLIGLRVSEARSIKPSNFDLTRGLSSITVTVRGKGDKTRVVPVSLEAWSALESRMAECISSDAMLVPVSDSGARRAFTRLGKEAGLCRRVASHDGRATVATTALNEGANIRVVQDILGHSSVTTTQLYTKVTMDQMREAVNFK